MKNVIRKCFDFKNVLFLAVIVLGALVVWKRYAYLPDDIVSHSDTELILTTEDGMLEQTWQPRAKQIAGVSMPYRVADGFTATAELSIYTDDYAEVVATAELQQVVFETDANGTLEFSFPRTKVTPGERYRIVICLNDASEKGALAVVAGSNHDGCTIGGTDTQCGAALTVTFLKYRSIFWLFAVLFPLLSISFFGMTVMHRKLEEVIGPTILLEGLILYAFSLIGQLPFGVTTVYVLALLAFIATIILSYYRNVDIREWISPGLFIFLIGFLVIVLADRSQILGMRDDLRHWGPAVKDMFYYDRLANHVDTTVILPRYMPFAALIEYLFVYMNGLYNEGIVMIAYHVMMLCALMIICRPLQKEAAENSRKGAFILKYVAVLATMVCVPILFFGDVPSSIRVDPLQGVIAAFLLVSYFSERLTKYNMARLVIGFCALVLLKDIGLVLGGIIAFIILCDIVVIQLKEKKRRVWEILYPIGCVAVMLGLWLGWQHYLTLPSASISMEDGTENAGNMRTSTAVSASGITASGVWNVLKGNGQDYQYEVADKLITEVFDGDAFQILGISLSFGDLFLLMAFLMLSLAYFGYLRTPNYRIITLSISSLLGAGLLCGFLLITYWFSFERAEALLLADFERYTAPYACAVLILLLWLLFGEARQTGNTEERKKHVSLVSIGILIVVISMPVDGIVTKSSKREGNTTEDMIYGYEEISEILRSVSTRGETVQYLCSESDGYSEYIFRNAVSPLVSNHGMWRIAGSQEILEEAAAHYFEETGEDYYADVVSVEDLKKHLSEFQYVVLFHADDAFRESYAELFEDCGGIVDGSVYRVEQTADGTELLLIGQTGIKAWR